MRLKLFHAGRADRRCRDVLPLLEHSACAVIDEVPHAVQIEHAAGPTAG